MFGVHIYFFLGIYIYIHTFFENIFRYIDDRSNISLYIYLFFFNMHLLYIYRYLFV